MTVTPNPSLDLTMSVDRLVAGDIHRATSTSIHPGGKGINVSRALARWGESTRAVTVEGGPSGVELLELLARESVDVEPIKVQGSVRVNVTVSDASGPDTKINSPGPVLSDAEIESLVSVVRRVATDARWVAMCGSLAAGMRSSLYADLIGGMDTPVAVDTTGAALRCAVDAGVTLIKPNVAELEELVGRSLHTLGDVVSAVESIRSGSTTAIAVSCGSEGALLVTDDGMWHGRAPVVVDDASVGAGDVFLAGLLRSLRLDAEALRFGVAAGAAACRIPGTGMPSVDQISLGEVELTGDIDMDLPIKQGDN